MQRGKEYLVKYLTFDQLLNGVRDDMEQYDAEGMIDASKLIKVVKTINKKLGLKLHREKEVILCVEGSVAKLPDDFYMFNFGLLCYNSQKIVPKIEGTHTEDFWVQLGCNVDTCNTVHKIVVPDTDCEKAKLFTNCKGDYYTIMQRFRNEVLEYKHFELVELKATRNVEISNGCFNIGTGSSNQITIQDGYIYCNFEEGHLYVNYIGDLVDEEGNLLILDHPLVIEYYEYALKRRVLENLYIDSGEDVVNKLSLVEQRFREARKTASRFVDTPEFSELQDIWLANRQQWYKKYYYPITGKAC